MDIAKYRPGIRLFDAVKDADFGTLFTYEELQEILEKDPQGPGRSIIHRVRDKLLVEKQKLLLAMDGEGYYIAHPDEHVGYAESMSDSGDRKKIKALKATVFVDASRLSAENLQALINRQVKLRLEIVTHRKIAAKVIAGEPLKLPTGEELLGIITKRK